MSPSPDTSLAALRRLAASLDVRPDEDLLAVFTARRDEAAFAAIVRRHGGLVLDVCRSVLRNEADAEDAFQATFLALAAKARTLRTPAALAGWLHGTACRVARKARRARNRRRAHEAHTPAPPDVPPPDPSWAEIREAIHEEINRLPERYRAAVVLFYLAGRTQDEVGQALGLSKDGAKKRLERGRALLRIALGRRGFGPAVLLAVTAVSVADPPAALATAAARMCLAREGVPAGILSLVPHGVRPMSTTSLLGAVSVLIAATALGFGVLRGGPPDQPPRPDTPVPAAAKPPAGGGDLEGARHRFTVLLTKTEPWPNATRCAFLDNDRILAQSGTSKVIEIRDARTGKLLKSVGIDKQFVGDFRLSADRKWVAAVTIADTTGTFVIPQLDVTVWDTTTWKVRGTIAGRLLLDVAQDGRTVLVSTGRGLGQGGRIEVWDVVEKKMLRAAPFEFKRIDAGAISPDGSLAAVSGLNEIAYWKWRDGDKHDRLKVGRKVDALVFSPNGKFVVEGPDSRMTVEVRDTATLKVAQALSDPAQPHVPFAVAGMAVADSGKTLAVGNGVGLIETIPVPHRIHFWDMTTGKLIRKIELKGGAPYSLDVSPDGKTLAVVTADGGVSLRVFDLGRGGGAPRE